MSFELSNEAPFVLLYVNVLFDKQINKGNRLS